MKYNGKLIAFEGIDRAGKSSVVKILADMLKTSKVPITICGELNSPFAPLLRDMLYKGSSPFLKTYLFASDRAWEYENKCMPALMRGEIVLWDRYVDSAIVYRTIEFQQRSSVIDVEFVKLINSPFILPDLSIYIDVSADTSLRRSKILGKKEPYDSVFLEKVRVCYLELALTKNYRLVNGEQPLETVSENVCNVIQENFKEFFS
ncbi:MAG TPA: dTMP kinase [Anaerolineales bacterium]|nr:dTMP kinase [Anaerolineales bacterium]